MAGLFEVAIPNPGNGRGFTFGQAGNVEMAEGFEGFKMDQPKRKRPKQDFFYYLEQVEQFRGTKHLRVEQEVNVPRNCSV